MLSDAASPSDAHAWLPWVFGMAVAACLAAAALLVDRYRQGLPLVPPRPHRPVPWDGRDIILVALGFFAVASLAGSMIGGQPALDVTLATNVIVFAVASILAGAWLMARGASAADLGIGPVCARQDVALALVSLALVVAPLLTLAAWLNTIMPYKHDVVDFLASRRDAWSISLVVVAACVAAPVAEELFFRRILQGWLEKRLPTDGFLATGLAAAVFAAAHYGQGLAYVPLFPLGVVLGLLASRTGSIMPSILLHSLFNAVSVALLLAGVAA